MKYNMDLSVFWFFRRIKVLPCILETDKSNDNNNTVIKVLSVKSSFCIWPVISFGILCVCQSLSRDQLFAIPWTVGPHVTHQTPLSMEFSRQEYWSGLPFPSPGNLPWARDQTQVSHIEGKFFTDWATREVLGLLYHQFFKKSKLYSF